MSKKGQATANLALFVSDLEAGLRVKAANAALRAKPTMWVYYKRMARHVRETYFGLPAAEVLRAARCVEQDARRMCLWSKDASDGDKALWYAYSVYARKILRAAGFPSRGWVGLWLLKEAGK